MYESKCEEVRKGVQKRSAKGCAKVLELVLCH